MYAIFENGSHQHLVREGDVLNLDKVAGDLGAELTFEKVLLISGGEDAPRIGTPLLEGAKVIAKVVRQYRDKKIIIQKFRRRKGYRRKKGHRQYKTALLVTSIVAG